MYEKDGRIISSAEAKEAAERLGLSLEDWLSQTGFSKVGSGKQQGSASQSPMAGPRIDGDPDRRLFYRSHQVLREQPTQRLLTTLRY